MNPDLLAGIGSLYLAGINGVTWVAFADDKAAAQVGDRRVPERTLLLITLIGGTPAAYFARHSLRHKTRKQPFSAQLHAIATAQVAVLIAASARLLGLY